MKKLLILLAATVLFASCGVGSYTVVTGKADQAELSVAAPSSKPIKIVVDQKDNYQVSTVKTKDWMKDRKIKKTVQNTITLTPGKHAVKIFSENGTELYSKTLYLGTNEHKVIEL